MRSNGKCLATTGISDMWDLDKEILLLGPWCITEESNRKLIDGKSYSIVPSPWKPSIMIKESADLCHQIYKDTLPELIEQLNLLHNISESEKYWKILIGPWLSYFIEVLYERYMRIENAFTLFSDAYTYTLPKSLCKLVAVDTYDFLSIRGKVTDDYYNLKLFSSIVYCLYPKNAIERNINRAAQKREVIPKSRFTKKLFYEIKKIKDAFYLPDIVLTDMYNLDWLQMLSLESSSRISRICFKNFNNITLVGSYQSYSDEQRNKLIFRKKFDKFKDLLRQLIPAAIPMCYVENFKKYKINAKGKVVKAIGSAVGWYCNEDFKFFAAESILLGAKLMDFQHGGGYDMYLTLPSETISLEKDIFYIWGRHTEVDEQKVTLPSPYLSKLKNTHRISDESILFVGGGVHKYLSTFSTVFTPDDISQYFMDKKILCKFLNNSPRRKLLYRPYQEIGWHEADSIKDLIPGIKMLAGSLITFMQRTRVVIIDYLGTVNLEALTINVPSVWFWNSSNNLIRPGAKKYFDLLREVGILHSSPEKAAEKVNAVYDDPLRWWQDPEVQKARNLFCDKFCITSDDWRKEWCKALDEYK